MTVGLVVATANVLCTLRRDEAREALRTVLDRAPDLIGLQEWALTRSRLLRETGSVRLVPRVVVRRQHRTARRGPGYVWAAPLAGGCAVGLRADRFELLGCHSQFLSWFGRGEGERRTTILPARIATVAVCRDRHLDRLVSVVSFHLAPGVQAGGRYREDRPRRAARHQHEVRSLQRLVDEQRAQGHVVYAVGDSNFDGLRLAGLTSAWEGREDDPGTLGPRRKVDDVHGPGRATSVTLLTTGSDHKAVVVSRSDL